MKNIKFLLLLITGIAFTSCEEVVDIDLDTAAPRLVVNASINWVKGTDGSDQTVRLTTTTGYYDDEIPVVTGATVFITNSDSTVFTFTEDPGTGNYNCTDFVPEIGKTYTLTVINDGQTYNATETLYAVPEIDEIIQNNEGGFLGDSIEVRFFFQDNGAEDNYYLVRFDTEHLSFPDYDVSDDRFFQGNRMYDFIDHEDFEAGDVVGIRLQGISERYYNYMFQLISIAEGGAGSGPFQSPPSNVRGNVVNQTTPGKNALGYFSLSETDTVEYTIQ